MRRGIGCFRGKCRLEIVFSILEKILAVSIGSSPVAHVAELRTWNLELFVYKPASPAMLAHILWRAA
jgi:hypothetical protein